MRHKIGLIGDQKVGKSSICNCLLNNYSDAYIGTIGVDFIHYYYLNKFQEFNLFELWDTGAIFSMPMDAFCMCVNAFIFVYDITDSDSFANIKNKLLSYQEKCDHHRSIHVILVGNKCDLESNRAVSYEEGNQFAENYGFYFFEVSAKESYGISKVFDTFQNLFCEQK